VVISLLYAVLSSVFTGYRRVLRAEFSTLATVPAHRLRLPKEAIHLGLSSCLRRPMPPRHLDEGRLPSVVTTAPSRRWIGPVSGWELDARTTSRAPKSAPSSAERVGVASVEQDQPVDSDGVVQDLPVCPRLSKGTRMTVCSSRVRSMTSNSTLAWPLAGHGRPARGTWWCRRKTRRHFGTAHQGLSRPASAATTASQPTSRGGPSQALMVRQVMTVPYSGHFCSDGTLGLMDNSWADKQRRPRSLRARPALLPNGPAAEVVSA
jgi:hypothetical protein